MRKLPIVCPKCKSANVNLIEVYERTITFYPEDYYKEGYMDSGGDIIGVHGECTVCDHSWKLRDISHMGDIDRTSHSEEKVNP